MHEIRAKLIRESNIRRHIIDDVISCECIDEQLEFQMIFVCGYDHSVILLFFF